MNQVEDIPAFAASVVTVVAIPKESMRGTPDRLAWSPDAKWIYIQSQSHGSHRHFIVDLEHSRFAPTNEEPDWAAEYWRQKAGRAAPGDPQLQIEVETDTSPAPKASGYAFNMPPGIDGRDMGASPRFVDVITVLKLQGAVIGQFRRAFAPGLTFGWAPPPLVDWMAYVDSRDRLVIMDADARRFVVTGARHVQLPAWSPDGRHIAFVEDARHQYLLRSATRNE